jgi:hypothetical protein
MSETTNDAGPKVFTLHRAVEHRGQRFETLTAREPRVRELRTFLKDVDRDAILAMEKVLANLCQVDEGVMESLSIKDFGTMKKWFEGFLLEMMSESED